MIPEFVRNPRPEVYMGGNYVVVDYETTTISYGDPRLSDNSIVCAAWKTGPEHSMYTGKTKVCTSTELGQAELYKAIMDADFVVAQNTKFELGWTKRIGVPFEAKLWYCTILGSYTLDGNVRRSRDLNSLASRYDLGCKDNLVSLLIKGRVDTLDIPISWLTKYCKQDVDLTEQVFLIQRAELEQQSLLGVAYTKNLFTPVLADMEHNGMYLDEERTTSLYNQRSKELAEAGRELSATFGDINFSSPIQVANLLYGDLKFKELSNRGRPIRNKPSKAYPDGQPKTDSATLFALVAHTAKQKRFVDLYSTHSKLSKQVGTYLKLFKETVDSGGHLYGNFNQSVTQTHRLSSSAPNFQNFDRLLKPLFTSRNEGWVIGERDEAQLEFRVAAYLGNDAQAREDIANEIDVHKYTASIIFSTLDCTKEERTLAKEHTFKPLYGGVSGTKLEKKYYAAFKEKYKGIAETQDEWVNIALCEGTFRNETGLIFRYKVKVTRSGYIEGNTNVRNYPVQYLATGEIVPIGCVYTWHYMKAARLESFMVNTVHDSIITEENPEETEQITEMANKGFGEDVLKYLLDVYGIVFDVPLDLETETSTYWSE